MIGMLLAALTQLCHPDVCLQPSMPLAQRQVEEGPAGVDAVALVAALLSSWQHLQGALDWVVFTSFSMDSMKYRLRHVNQRCCPAGSTCSVRLTSGFVLLV